MTDPDQTHNHIDDDDLACVELLADAAAREPGIVNVALDREGESVRFQYDPARSGRDDVARVAAGIAPELGRRWSSCTMLIDGIGGRACESCALALEQKLAAIPGVRRASVSYRGGALSIHYDPGALSPAELESHVESLRIPRA
ncbi:MAG: hypothetical protein GX579_17320, partial [Chloroflexi bacterium]|nr:hypothetical protein [Chloroflexota bacterium]